MTGRFDDVLMEVGEPPCTNLHRQTMNVWSDIVKIPFGLFVHFGGNPQMGEALNSKPTNTGDRCMHISSKGSCLHSIGTCFFRLGG